MDSDSSSDSDDDFLTIGSGGPGGVDREALIRKKLMESFYGKAAADGQDGAELQHPTTGEDGSGNHASSDFGGADGAGAASTEDLDSAYFDAAAHTKRHVITSSVQTLLETEERLALEVRTLDSTMQTLVYENYSRFIDATDAIRSIGVNVQANEQGLSRLSKGMQIVDEQSRAVEDDLGALRDAVAEKIRMKRLLTRLDALLKLPKTLKEQIATGQYRKATKSYLTATSILSKHSAGFESLQKIEVECNEILEDMLQQLKRKLLYWSGQKNSLSPMIEHGISDDSDAMQLQSNDDDSTSLIEDEEDDDDEFPPEPPKTVKEIFECSGTLTILLPRAARNRAIANQRAAGQSGESLNDKSKFDTGLTVEDCRSMSLLASLRLIERLFDAHHLEMHDISFGSSGMDESAVFNDATERSMASALGGPIDESTHTASKGKNLIPTKVIDAILEAATLYGMTFGSGGHQGELSRGNLLVDFVSEAFDSFLSHVRSILLERTMQLQRALDDADGMDMSDAMIPGDSGMMTADEVDNQVVQESGDSVYEELSGAMSVLLHCVRELASALTLPEVGISAAFASDLVDQTEDLTQTMLRRRVDQKFCDLRLSIVQDCLVPFALRAFETLAAGDNSDEQHSKVLQIVQMAGVALSDCLQLVDDTVRSIIADGNVLGVSRIDLPVLKQAIEHSTSRLAVWLAGTLEVLAGCEPSDARVTFQALPDVVEGASDSDDDNDEVNYRRNRNASGRTSHIRDDISEVTNELDPVIGKVDAAIQELLAELDHKSTAASGNVAFSDLSLAMCEMCRVGSRTVVENISQSIASHSGSGEKKKSSELFVSNVEGINRKGPRAFSEREKQTSERFRLAASRILALYAINMGSDAASILCENLSELSELEEDDTPDAPRMAALHVLEIAKLTSIDCADLFGGSKRAGPIPEVDIDQPSTFASSHRQRSTSTMKGLQLDVERMFKEKVSVYPHPSQFVDFTRNAVVTIVFKVAFKALLEQSRFYSFSKSAYRQLQVDVEFLRHMIPHYVKDDFLAEGTNSCSFLSNMLTDVMASVGSKCLDRDFVSNEYNIVTTRSIVKDFMQSMQDNDVGDDDITTRFIIPED